MANDMKPQWIDYRAWHHDKKVMMHVSEIDFREYGCTADLCITLYCRTDSRYSK